MYLLAIESSCDDTSSAVFENDRLLSQADQGQVDHAAWGGVVPEIASRAHQQAILPVVHQALSEAGIDSRQLGAVAVTLGPGLLGSLLVGQSFAKGLALSLGVPLLGVNHMEAHVLANLLSASKPEFPFLCLTVSGGHTQLLWVEGPLQMTVLGQTLDDAVGEAFDKCGKMLGLPYPGGPLVDKLAAEGNPKAYKLPISDIPGLNYSFSGVKTAFYNLLQPLSEEERQRLRPDLCASLQHTLIATLMQKLEMAAKQTGARQVALAGGVSANKGLRLAVKEAGVRNNWQTFVPELRFCTDNAAMIGITAWHMLQAGKTTPLDEQPKVRYAEFSQEVQKF